MRFQISVVINFIFCVATVCSCLAQETSPKEPWKDLEHVNIPEDRTDRDILLYLPNRLLDFLDIFRFDVGAGLAYGGVVRISKYAQAGYRSMDPASLRIGHFGRKSPYIARVESSNELGVSPAFKQSKDREVCKAEIGLGLDLLVGAYAGICLDELVDFIGGIFTADFKDDDYR